MVVERDLPVEMSDGVTLLADRWAPAAAPCTRDCGPPPPPIVLVRSPYGRRRIGMVGRLFAERGYQVVIQSCRGTFGSGGEWLPFRHERSDGHDTLAWLASQPWFGGSVVTFGPSYLGLVQWALCEDPPDFLRAMAPAVTSSCFRDAVVYPGGAFALETSLSWVSQLEAQEAPRVRVLARMLRGRRRLQAAHAALPLSEGDRRAVGRRVAFYQDWLAHDRAQDPWWDPVDFRRGRAQAPPATLLAGWYDIFLPEQVEDFLALRAAARPARITIGPWTHTSPGGLAAGLRDGLAWFERHSRSPAGSRGASDPPLGGGVRFFVMGAKRWIELPDWPPPAAVQRWHLHAGGLLDPKPPGDSAPDHFRYDPADPTPSVGGASLDPRSGGRKDQSRRERRSDVLVYTSAPLERAMTVAGPLSVDLFFASSRVHTDAFVRLCVVRRGRSTNLSDGIVRLGPETTAVREDGVLQLRVRMWPTAVTFRPGERIRLQVSSGAHPLYARNTGCGPPLASAMTLHCADQHVWHDPAHPSAVELPVSPL